MNKIIDRLDCDCDAAGTEECKTNGKKKIGNSALSITVSILIAFFPKCPMCWAAYMSMFGCVGLSELPYMTWVLPVLFCFLALHLYFLFKRCSRTGGFLPFTLAILGALTMLSSKLLYPSVKWMPVTAMAFIIAGSLLSSFATSTLFFTLHKQYRK